VALGLRFEDLDIELDRGDTAHILVARVEMR